MDLGKKSNQVQVCADHAPSDPKIVGEGVVQAHDFQVGDLFHDPAGPFAGDNDFGTRSCQRLCTLDRLLAPLAATLHQCSDNSPV